MEWKKFGECRNVNGMFKFLSHFQSLKVDYNPFMILRYSLWTIATPWIRYFFIFIFAQPPNAELKSPTKKKFSHEILIFFYQSKSKKKNNYLLNKREAKKYKTLVRIHQWQSSDKKNPFSCLLCAWKYTLTAFWSLNRNSRLNNNA